MCLVILIPFDFLFISRNVPRPDFQNGTTLEEIPGDMNLGLSVDATDLNHFVIALKYVLTPFRVAQG
jgi:hypothetical protein